MGRPDQEKVHIMKKRTVGATLLALCMASACWIPNARAVDVSPTTKSVSLSAFYLSGKYGHAQRTDIYYIPFTARVHSGRFSFSASLPYLRITGPGNVLPNIGSVGTGSTVRSTHSGMGDIRLGADYRFWNDTSHGLALTLGARVKLGTADHQAGLGTGKNDYAMQLRLSRAVGKWYLAATGGYRKQGSPATVHVRNVVYGQADIIYTLDRANSLGLSTFYNQASVATGTTRLMSAAYFTHHLAKDWSATFYAMKGYTRSSPDYGIGASIRYGF
jgi:hypothetical protein